MNNESERSGMGIGGTAPLVALGAWTTPSAQDRASIDTASKNQAIAKEEADKAFRMAQQVLDASKAVQLTVAQASQTALEAAKATQAPGADARVAKEKVDRTFQRSLHQ